MNKIYLIIYFALALVIGYMSYKKVRNGKDFYIAGKEAGTIQVAGSLLATILGSSAILGSINTAYKDGWAGSWLMICASLGLAVLYPFTKYIREFQGYNLPGLMCEFYGEEVKKISSLIIAVAWLGVVAAQIMGAAKILTVLTSMSYTAGVLISGGVFIVYTLLGGQLSVIKTDFIQLIIMIIGLVATFLFIKSEPITLPVMPAISERFTTMDLIVMILTYSTTFFVGPDIYSRLFCAKDEKTIKRSLIITIMVLLQLSYIFARIGIYGMQVFHNVDIGRESVLFVIASQKLPGVVAILLYFALLSAVISSADTTLLTGASLLTQVFTKDMDSKKGILMTRIFIAVIGILSFVITLKMTSILGTILLALSVYSGAVIVPTVAGMIGYRTHKNVIISVMLIGGIISLIGKLHGGDIGNYISISAFVVDILILLVFRGKKQA